MDDTVLDGHLAAPLYKDPFVALRDLEFRELCSNHRRAIAGIPRFILDDVTQFNTRFEFETAGVDWWGIIPEEVMSREEGLLASNSDKAISIAYEFTKSHFHHLFPYSAFPFELPNLPVPLLKHIDRYFKAGSFKTKVRTTFVNNENWVVYSPNLSYCEKISLFKRHGKWYMIETNLVLGAIDKVQEFTTLLVHNWLNDLMFPLPSLSRTDDLLLIYEEVVSMRRRIPDRVNTILKCLETLVISYVVSRDQKYPSNTLLEDTLNDVLEVEGSFRQSHLYGRMLRLSNSTLGIHYMIDSAGYAKTFGHPLIDPQRGFDELRERCIRRKLETIPQSIRVASCFKKIISENFFARHHKWPNQDENRDHEYFGPFVTRNTWPTPRQMKAFGIEAWFSYNLKDLLKFKTDMPMYDIITDKSLAPHRSHWAQCFDRCTFTRSQVPRPYLPEYEILRVVSQYLKCNEGFIKDCFDHIQRYHSLPPEERIFVLVPKELEQKEQGRMFCKQTLMTRTIQVVKEMNIKEKLMEYIPYQTMSLTGIEVDSKLIKIAKLHKASSQSHIVYINVDFSKWNSRFRYENTAAPFGVIDEVFGLDKVYEYTHKHYEECLIVYQDRLGQILELDEFNEPVGGGGGHKYHLAGFEGMAQKAWTLVTISLIKLHAFDFDYDITIIGQGDNQVICLLVEGTEANPEYVRQYLLSLDESMTEYGLPLKPAETYVSTDLFSYGKTHFFKGTEVPNSIKKLRRSFPDGSEALIGVSDDLSSISTSTESAARCSYLPYSSLILSAFLHIEVLHRLDICKIQDKSISDWIVILSHNNQLGGISQISPISHMIRGIEDITPYFMSYFRHINHCNYCNINENSLNKYLHIRENRSRDFQALLENPYVLNIVHHTPPMSWIKDLAKGYIFREATNTEITKWINLNVDQRRDELIGMLSGAQPQYPKINSEIFRNSSVGIADGLNSRLSNVRTITREAVNREEHLSGSHAIIDRYIKDVEDKKNYISCEFRRGVHLSQFYRDTCSVRATRHLRESTWGMELEGLECSFPLEQVTLMDPNDPDPPEGYITVNINDVDFETAITSRGPFNNYLGSKTKERVATNPLTDIEVTEMGTKLKRLLTLAGWAKTERMTEYLPIISDEINIICNTLELGLPPESLLNFVLVESDNPDHRLNNAQSSTTYTPCYITNVSTHIDISTTTLSTEFKSQDRTIVYQYVMLWLTCQSMQDIRDGRTGVKKYRFSCGPCSKEIPQGEISVPNISHLSLPRLPFTFNSVVTNIDMDQSIKSALYGGHSLGVQDRKRVSVMLLDVLPVMDSHLYKDSFPNLNLRILRAADLTYLLSCLVISTGFIEAIEELEASKRECDCSVFDVTANAFLDANLVNYLVKHFNVPITKHRKTTNSEQLSKYITEQLFSRVKKNKIKPCIVSGMSSTLINRIIISVIFNIPLYPWKVSVRMKDIETVLTEREIDYVHQRRDLCHNPAHGQMCSCRPPYTDVKLDRRIQYCKITLPSDSTPAEKYFSSLNRGFLEIIRKIIPICDDLFTLKKEVYVSKGIAADYKVVESINHGVHLYPKVECLTVSNTNQLKTDYTLVNIKGYNVHQYTRLLRRATSAASKYFEIISHLGIQCNPSEGILCLAEGGGSVLTMLKHLFPESWFYFNTLWNEPNMTSTVNIPQFITPSEISDPCTLPKSINTGLSLTTSGDLLSGRTWQVIQDEILLSGKSGKVKLITVDIESLEEISYPKIFKHLNTFILNNIHLVSGCYVIFKLIAIKNVGGLDMAYGGIDELHICSDSYTIVKPPSSNPLNHEYFLCFKIIPGAAVHLDGEDFLKMGGYLYMLSRSFAFLDDHTDTSLLSQSAFINRNPCYSKARPFIPGHDVDESSCACLSIVRRCNIAVSELRKKSLGDFRVKLPLLFQSKNQQQKLDRILEQLQDKINSLIATKLFVDNGMKVSQVVGLSRTTPGIRLHRVLEGGFSWAWEKDVLDCLSEYELKEFWHNLATIKEFCVCDLRKNRYKASIQKIHNLLKDNKYYYHHPKGRKDN